MNSWSNPWRLSQRPSEHKSNQYPAAEGVILSMSLAVVHTRARLGIDAPEVTVETHLSPGLPGLSIVGLPEAAVRESKDRVRSAIINSNFDFPTRRITINLAPADLPKEGGRFDLAIALGILAASGQIPPETLHNKEFLGELALSGELRPVLGLLPASIASTHKNRTIFVPYENGDEAALPNKASVIAATSLLDVCGYLMGNKASTLHPQPSRALLASLNVSRPSADMADVKAQHQAKRALEIAAAGGHSLLMSGPPGTGKTMLASRLPGILPPLTEDEALEVAAIASITLDNTCAEHNWCRRPFRNPHHTASAVALVGGGSNPRPGEISLAHRGVLFLDELPEFDRRVLEVLREPLESGEIMISRAAQQVKYPASFQLIAAMNPCPCGYHGDPSGRCHCNPEHIKRYRNKLSGPLMDRIDLHITVPVVPHAELRRTHQPAETSHTVQQRVCFARNKQRQRQGKANFLLNSQDIEKYCPLSEQNQLLLEQAAEKLALSARAFHRILRVARTIADLEDSADIQQSQLMEALSYRPRFTSL